MSMTWGAAASGARSKRRVGRWLLGSGLALSASAWSAGEPAAAALGIEAVAPSVTGGEGISALPGVRSAVFRPAEPAERGHIHLVQKAPSGGVPDVLSSPKVSQLPWRSGVSSRFGAEGPDETEFGTWRGRPVDVHVLFVEHDTWEDMTRHLTGDYFRIRVQQSPQPVISLPMMPRSEPKQHAACAKGLFNARFQEFGRNLIAIGAGNAVVRLGWEANIGSDSHPWGIDTSAEIPNYKRCFAQLVTALRSTARSIKIEWSIGKKYDSKMPALTTYPGNSYVDIWGLHYYDRPPVASQQDWDAEVNSIEGGKLRHPVGIGAWLAEAKKNRKRLAVPEWGVWNNDNPLYIELMYKFFKANAASIAYENYFNLNEKHQIFVPDGLGTTAYPQSAEKYRQLWSTAP